MSTGAHRKFFKETYFVENVHLKIIYTFTIKLCVLNKHNALKWHFTEQDSTLAKIFDRTVFNN
jgi:hypothetical protein